MFRKSCRLWDNVEKCSVAREATDDNTIRRMRFTWWITKATDTRSYYLILKLFNGDDSTQDQYLLIYHGNNGYVNASHCYVLLLGSPSVRNNWIPRSWIVGITTEYKRISVPFKRKVPIFTAFPQLHYHTINKDAHCNKWHTDTGWL